MKLNEILLLSATKLGLPFSRGVHPVFPKWTRKTADRLYTVCRPRQASPEEGTYMVASPGRGILRNFVQSSASLQNQK